MELVTIFYTDENLNSDERVDSISEGAAGAKGPRKSLPGDNNIWHLCIPGTHTHALLCWRETFSSRYTVRRRRNTRSICTRCGQVHNSRTAYNAVCLAFHAPKTAAPFVYMPGIYYPQLHRAVVVRP